MSGGLISFSSFLGLVQSLTTLFVRLGLTYDFVFLRRRSNCTDNSVERDVEELKAAREEFFVGFQEAHDVILGICFTMLRRKCRSKFLLTNFETCSLN